MVLQSNQLSDAIYCNHNHWLITYALVISASGPAIGGVQIIDITTPSNPTAVSAAIAGPGNGYTQLDGTTSIDTITVDSRTYALVTSNYGSPNGGFEITRHYNS